MNQAKTVFENHLSFAKGLDQKDSLKKYRELFHFPKDSKGNHLIYLCGNSLGLQPKSAKSYIDQELDDWARLGVEGHFHAKHPWMPYHEILTQKMAGVVNAKPVEVVVMNSLTVNLHLMMVSFYRPTMLKNKIVIEQNAFPSDQYAVKSQIHFHGYSLENSLLEISPEPNENWIRTENILKIIEEQGDSIALLLLGGVNYYTGQAFQMKLITEAAHKKNILVGFDLAHAAGNIELRLHDWNVDFAVWCSYKYLNSGPGGIAGCFVHEHFAMDGEMPRFAGWWGHRKETRFSMPSSFSPINGAEGWQLSNPPILTMASLKASLDIFDEAGMENLCNKSRLLTGFMEFLLDDLQNSSIEIITPKDPEQRGAQLSIRVKNSNKELFTGLIKKGVICDWREPDVIRAAPVPLYNSFEDVFLFVDALKKAGV